METPAGGIAKGSVFGCGPNLSFGNQWEVADGGFALAAGGDAVLIYCKDSVEDETVQHLAAFSFNGEWETSGLEEDDYETGTSALPDDLAPLGAIALPHFDNYIYEGSTLEGTKAQLQSALMESSNWKGSNSERFSVEAMVFTVKKSASREASMRLCLIFVLISWFWLVWR